MILPPRKQKKVDEEKGADGRMDDCCLNNVGMDFTFDCRETREWSMAFRYDKPKVLMVKTKSTKVTPNWRLETGVIQKLVGCTTTRG